VHQSSSERRFFQKTTGRATRKKHSPVQEQPISEPGRNDCQINSSKRDSFRKQRGTQQFSALPASEERSTRTFELLPLVVLLWLWEEPTGKAILEKGFPGSKQPISELGGLESCQSIRRRKILSGTNGRSQSRREPNPVAFSSILNKWRSQKVVIETDQFHLPCADVDGLMMMGGKVMFREDFYGFGIRFEFNFPWNDTLCELYYANRFRRFEAD
jgi:hypothetical protein